MLTIKMNIEVALVAILFSGLVPVTSAVVQSQKLNVSDIARNGTYFLFLLKPVAGS